MFAIPADLYPTSEPLTQPALVIMHLAIDSYFNDIKMLVINGIDKWIKDSKDNHDINRQTVNRVKTSFSQWKTKTHPFDYAHYLLLCDIVNPSGTSLPPSATPQLTLRTFLQSLVQLGLHQAKNGPPFVKAGSFQHILPVALQKLQEHSTEVTTDSAAYAAEVMERVWLQFRLHNIPWSAPAEPHGRGRRATTVVYNAWSHFGGRRDPHPTTSVLQPHQQRTSAVQQKLQQILQEDADSPWKTSDIRVQDIHTILHRHMLPDDFIIPVLSPHEHASYVGETYRYVRENFALPETLHQLALIMGIIFSKLTPNVFTVKPEAVPSQATSTEHSTREYLNTLDWETRDKKGLTQQNIFVSMVTTYIIAFYDANSPLRNYIATHGHLGKSWTEKHCERLYT